MAKQKEEKKRKMYKEIYITRLMDEMGMDLVEATARQQEVWSNVSRYAHGARDEAAMSAMRIYHSVTNPVTNALCDNKERYEARSAEQKRRHAIRQKDRAALKKLLGEEYMRDKEVHHDWGFGEACRVFTHQEHLEFHRALARQKLLRG